MAVKHRWVDGDGSMASASSWKDATSPATKATGVLTLTGLPLDTETVVIDTKTYTFKTVLSDTDGFVLIGASASDSIDNLVAAITLGAGAGTLYANSTTLHPSATAAAGPGDTLDATAKLRGTDGNSIASTETLTNGSWGAGTLGGATQWATDDEIIVDMDATQDFTADLDWSTTFCSPELRLARFNVDRTNIKFGAPGNSIKLSLAGGGALNYLGTGMMYADFKGTLNVFVNALCSQPVLNLNVRGVESKYIIVNGGTATIIAGAIIDLTDGTSQVFTTGPHAKLIIEGADEDGASVVVAYRGTIENSRRAVDQWLVIGAEGTLVQKGYVASTTTADGLLNLGGNFSYQPINDPIAFAFQGRHLDGVSRLDQSDFELLIGDVIQGVEAQLHRGPNVGIGAVDIDLADDFPF